MLCAELDEFLAQISVVSTLHRLGPVPSPPVTHYARLTRFNYSPLQRQASDVTGHNSEILEAI
jgi:hypothetical protein